MDGHLVKDEAAPKRNHKEYAFAHRAGIQKVLLDQLLQNATSKESDFLEYGASVELHEEDNGQVKVTLNDGTILIGKALLGCDGIHSHVRRCMNKSRPDPLQYLGTTCYLGECSSDAVNQDVFTDNYDA